MTASSSHVIKKILAEDDRRLARQQAPFDPLTGQGCPLERFPLSLPDFYIPHMEIPISMKGIPLIEKLAHQASIQAFITHELHEEVTPSSISALTQTLVRLRCQHDFCFWAYLFVVIKNKSGGPDIPFRLNIPQRRLLEEFERMRLNDDPIRLILLKARQWGGSTLTQIYMAWIQLMHKEGWNSLIVAHFNSTSAEVRGMFEKMIRDYPTEMLYPPGSPIDPSAPKIMGVAGTTNINQVPARNCKIKTGSAENPNSSRGGDSALVHCTEVAFWRKTDGKSPEEIVRSACSGVAALPYTMIVYESTANGTNNFFHREYLSAKEGASKFTPLFIPWYMIEMYALPFKTPAEREAFALELYTHREAEQTTLRREEPGAYLWKLWEKGATLEAIQWYRFTRRDYEEHSDMASEYPSDDVEAFKHSGDKVFNPYRIEELRIGIRPPAFRGEVVAKNTSGPQALEDLHFSPDPLGLLEVWSLPEIFPDEQIQDRYLVVVDVGGRSKKADFSVILVLDRFWMIEGGKPHVVAQWRGHIDHDLLAWKATQIAAFYSNALLVIESNTLETRDRDRDTDGLQTHFILSTIRAHYNNLYARKQSEEDIVQGIERKWGFHTNVSTKPMIISTLIKAIREGLYVERDEKALDEFFAYEKKPNGAFGAVTGSHDDILMTRAIGLHICFTEMPLPTSHPISRTTKPHSRKPLTEASF